MNDFKIWYDAVTTYLRSQGVDQWYEGNVKGGYAIFGGPEVHEKIKEFNKQYVKASIRGGQIPKLGTSTEFTKVSGLKQNVTERLRLALKERSKT